MASILPGFLFMPYTEGFEKTRYYTQKALDLDPGHSEAHNLMAIIYQWYERDWDIMRDDSRFKKLVKRLNFPDKLLLRESTSFNTASSSQRSKDSFELKFCNF
jgi:hypothetical protein